MFICCPYMQDWLYFLSTIDEDRFATWFVIDIVTFNFHRGDVISTIRLHSSFRNWTYLHFSISFHATTWNVLQCQINVPSGYVRTRCPCSGTHSRYFNKFKFRNFQELLAVQLACLLGSVQYVIHQIEMQRVWSSTIDCLLEYLEGCKAHLRGVSWFAAFGIYANLS